MATSTWYYRFRALLNLIIVQSLLPVTLTFVTLQYIHQFYQSIIGGPTAEAESAPPTLSAQTLAQSSSTVTTDADNSDVDSDTAETSSTDDAMLNNEDSSDADSDIVISDDEQQDNDQSYTVVLTGGKMSKTLHIVRCLRSFADDTPGVTLKVIVLEQDKFRYCATRFSRCVDHFEIITSPRISPEEYQQGIYDVCQKYKATHFLPVAAPVEAVYDAQVKERLENELDVAVLHMDYELCTILDDKHRFGTFLQDTLKLKGSPRTVCVTNNEQVHHYNRLFQKEQDEGTLKRTMVLKNLAYDPIHRLDLFQLPTTEEKVNAYLAKVELDGNAITEEEPWQLQGFLAGGVEYAAMIVVRNNHLVTMTCCPSSASQLNYIHIEIPAIRQWMDEFMKALAQSDYDLTGQLCFDFMVIPEAGGKQVAYPIECNPRVHTQCSIYNRDDVRTTFGSILLNPRHSQKEDQLVSLLNRDYGLAEKDVLNVYWFYNEFFKIFPNTWLLTYNDDADVKKRSKLMLETTPSVSINELFILGCYLPSLCLAVMIASPVLLCMFLVWQFQDTTTTESSKCSVTQHGKAILLKSIDFLRRLADMHKNIEGDLWRKDPFPFIAKNHIQIPSRLLATLRTGVEWKKIDFAIGKVVEVGGD